VPSSTDPGDERPDTVSSRLNDGLRSCRAVLSNYRALLAEDRNQLSDQAGLADDAKGSADQDERERANPQNSELAVKT
jgi:hypothetical protein